MLRMMTSGSNNSRFGPRLRQPLRFTVPAVGRLLDEEHGLGNPAGVKSLGAGMMSAETVVGFESLLSVSMRSAR